MAETMGHDPSDEALTEPLDDKELSNVLDLAEARAKSAAETASLVDEDPNKGREWIGKEEAEMMAHIENEGHEAAEKVTTKAAKQHRIAAAQAKAEEARKAFKIEKEAGYERDTVKSAVEAAAMHDQMDMAKRFREQGADGLADAIKLAGWQQAGLEAGKYDKAATEIAQIANRMVGAARGAEAEISFLRYDPKDNSQDDVKRWGVRTAFDAAATPSFSRHIKTEHGWILEQGFISKSDGFKDSILVERRDGENGQLLSESLIKTRGALREVNRLDKVRGRRGEKIPSRKAESLIKESLDKDLKQLGAEIHGNDRYVDNAGKTLAEHVAEADIGMMRLGPGETRPQVPDYLKPRRRRSRAAMQPKRHWWDFLAPKR